MKKFLKENYRFLLLIFLIIIIRCFFYSLVRVNGTSMEKTLYNGNILLLDKTSSYSQNDIVVISKKYEGDETIIKRIIALPHDTIEISNGEIYINNVLYKDSYGVGTTSDYPKTTLEDDEYFVLGDNREVSNDSRYLGPVKNKYIKGICKIRLFPFTKIGMIK